MAITILTRPIGYIQSGGVNTITNQILNNNGSALVNITSHGYPNGFVFYSKLNVIDYNGFVKVEVFNANAFYILDDAGDRIPYVNGASGTLSEFNTPVLWSCVHLPIVYKLSNDLWPTNSVDTVRAISSVTDSNGYCALGLSGDIKATGSAEALEFIKVTGATDDDLNGVWQIIAYTNDTTFTVNIPYSSANDTSLTGASIQYYYNNYIVKVQVWGGLNNGHEYYSQKPYTLLATIDCIPDAENRVMVSVNEILKQQIAIENNLLLGTLPNNLDAWTGFFIKYAEVYDDSDGTTLTQTTPSYTSDLTSFEGKAANAMLPFKNVYSGALSEYTLMLSTGGTFLTNFENPVLFSDKHFDLSFIWDGASTVMCKLEYYSNGVLQSTVYSDPLDAFYTGVYRFQIESDCDYDRVDVTAYRCSQYAIPAPNATTGVNDLWTDVGSIPFTKTATEFQVSPITNGDNSEAILSTAAINYFKVHNGDIVIVRGVSIETSGLSAVVVFFYATNSNGTSDAGFDNTVIISDGTHTDDWMFTATGDRDFYRMVVDNVTGLGTIDINLPDYIYVLDGARISETKTISIDCNCVKSKATGYYLSWLNNLGGFDYWYFTAYADNIINITNSGETKRNIFPEWPNSYGEFADTIKKQTYREANEQVLIRSQHLTEEQVEVLKSIKTSPIVQIVNSIYDRRTVLVDTDSFTYLPEGKNLHELSFTITYTDDVPSQRV
jgi:hypothetical protein